MKSTRVSSNFHYDFSFLGHWRSAHEFQSSPNHLEMFFGLHTGCDGLCDLDEILSALRLPNPDMEK